MLYLALAALLISFVILFKCADLFVEGASSLAEVLNIPKLMVGIVLVGLATTAPEFVVSVQAAFLKHPEIALGNAIGSVICDDGIALALAGILAPTAILVNCRMLKAVGIFLLTIDLLAYFLSRNGIFSRLEGVVLLVALSIYFLFLFKNQNFRYHNIEIPGNAGQKTVSCSSSKKEHLKKPAILFLIGIIGVIITGNIIIKSAVYIARYFMISEIIIGSTIIAIGTSLPEISTCITAARKGEGEIAVGNIIGADVLNILWIIGVSALVRPIQVDLSVINFAFPFMILIVIVMLAALRIGCRLGKIKGFVLLSLYLIYLFFILKMFA